MKFDGMMLVLCMYKTMEIQKENFRHLSFMSGYDIVTMAFVPGEYFKRFPCIKRKVVSRSQREYIEKHCVGVTFHLMHVNLLRNSSGTNAIVTIS